jgi:hypothetical protein
MNLVLGAGYAVIGLVLVLWAAPLSVRYNAWTTGAARTSSQCQPAANSGMAGAKYQDHDSYASSCWCVLSSAFDYVSLAADRY